MNLLHECIRGSLARLADILPSLAASDRDRLEGLARWFEMLRTVMHHHHHSEDIDLFALLVTKDAGFAIEQRSMQSEHAALTAALDEMQAMLATLGGDPSAFEADRARLAEALAALRREMEEHLSREEREVMPRMLRFMTRGDVKELERATLRHTTVRDFSLVLPMVYAVADAKQKRLLDGFTPWPVRLICRWRWAPRFRALERVLGDAPMPADRAA